MSEKQMLVFDCETNGLLHDLSEIHCIAIFDSQKEETFVFNNQGGDCYPITEGLHWLSSADIIVGHNILGFDLPGHGYTAGPIVNSIDEHSLFCIDVFDQLDIKEPILIGHSWGGLVALDLSTKVKHKMTICMNIAYPFLVGDMLLDFAKGNLDQAVEFLMKYGIHKFPKTEIKTKGFGTMGSGFYGRKKGLIKSPYGTKVDEDDPEREIKLYPLNR